MMMSIGIVIGTLLIFAIITDSLYKENLFKEVDQQLFTHKNMILNDAHIQYLDDEVKEVILPSPLVKELMNYVWYGDQPVKDSPHAYKGSTPYPIFPEQITDKVVSLRDGAYHYRGLQFRWKGCTVQILLSVDSQIKSIGNLERALVIALGILLVGVIIISLFLTKLALKPLYVAYYKQAAFIQDASHEMRTPLTIIKGKLELIVRKPKDCIEAHYEAFSEIMTEISGLEKLNRDLLLLSKEDMQGILEIKTVETKNFFEEITEFYEEVAEFHEVILRYTGLQQNLDVQWDEVKVKRCVSILIENAIKYTQEGGMVELSTSIEDKNLKVCVSDNGRGIKKEDMPHIFERFYRSSEIRAAGIEGSGIGLSLLQSLAHTMGIKMKVESEYGEGSQFILWIPRYMSSQ